MLTELSCVTGGPLSETGGSTVPPVVGLFVYSGTAKLLADVLSEDPELSGLLAEELSGNETFVEMLEEGCAEATDEKLEELPETFCAPPTSIIFIL